MEASPVEPLRLVMGCSERVLYDHVRRLERADFVRRVRMAYGDGSLIVITPDGARAAGLEATVAPRSVAPTVWAHTVACAWTGAWFEVRGRPWLSSREVIEQDGWQGQVSYEDTSRRTRRQLHRPDLGGYVGQQGIPVAIEVELQRKSPARMRGILRMYDQRIDDYDGDLAGVIYITGNDAVTRLLRNSARAVGLGEYPNGRLRILSLEYVIDQARQIAGSNAA